MRVLVADDHSVFRTGLCQVLKALAENIDITEAGDFQDVGSVTLSPERQPGARRLIEIRSRINRGGLRCVFAEPPFRASLTKTIVRGTRARSAMLDPMGTSVAPGPDALEKILRSLAQSVRNCLS